MDETTALALDRRYVGHGFGFTPIVVAKTKGAIVTDINGKEYLDFIAGTMGDAVVGHSHPKVVEAMKRQLDSMISCNTIWSHLPRIELAAKLAKITPPGLTKTLFSMSGSQAVEAALKGAMKITGRKEVIGYYWACHGLTFGTMGISQSWYRKGYPLLPGFRQMPPAYCYRCPWGKSYPGCGFECALTLEQVLESGSSHDVAAFIVEPITGLGGHMMPPDKEYFKIVRETCDKYDVLLISDEWQAGLGRTGKMLSGDHFDLKPDIIIVGKGLGGGLPVAATIFKEDALKDFDLNDIWLAFTHGGYPLGCAAGSAVLDLLIEERLPEKAAELGSHMSAKLKEMAERHRLIGDIRGPGLYIAVELVKDRRSKKTAHEEADRVMSKCLKKGLILMQSFLPDGRTGNIIMMKPALIITKEQADKALEIFEESLSEVESDAT